MFGMKNRDRPKDSKVSRRDNREGEVHGGVVMAVGFFLKCQIAVLGAIKGKTFVFPSGMLMGVGRHDLEIHLVRFILRVLFLQM